MSHQKGFTLAIRTNEEMIAVRAVLKAFGYKLYTGFEYAKDRERYSYVVYSKADGFVERTSSQLQDGLVTLDEFIANQAIPVKTPAQLELAKLEEESKALQARIITLKALI